MRSTIDLESDCDSNYDNEQLTSGRTVRYNLSHSYLYFNHAVEQELKKKSHFSSQLLVLDRESWTDGTISVICF